MVELRDDLDPAAIARLGSLEVIAHTLVAGFLKGAHLSADKGSSVEFLSYRPYVQGDEIRRLDWRTFGKTDRFYVKDYQDETNLRAILVLDVSASMGFGSGEVTKLRYATCLAAAFGYLLVGQRDAVGLALIDSRVRELLRPKATPERLGVLFARLARLDAGGETRLAEAIDRLAGMLPRRSLVVLLSDLLDDPRAVLRSLGRLQHRGCDVLVLHLIDPAEESFPFNRWVRFRDSESPGVELRLDGRRVGDLYREKLAEHLDILGRGCRGTGIDHALVSTARPFAVALAAFLESRGRAARRARASR